MNITLGIMCHNEEKNILNLLNSIPFQFIDEIIIVSSSNDSTNKIIKKFRHKKIKLIEESERKGKSYAINLFLERARNNYLIVSSADLIYTKNCLEILASNLDKPNIGIVGAKSIPINSKGVLGKIIAIQWRLHDIISKKTPKFGELIAFKKVLNQIPLSAVDEEEIANIISEQGLKKKYCDKAIVLNKGPTKLKELINQRRRIYCGHLELENRTNHKVPTTNNTNLAFQILKHIHELNIAYLFIAILLESYSRILGYIDFKRKVSHNVWKIAKTTKNLT